MGAEATPPNPPLGSPTGGPSGPEVKQREPPPMGAGPTEAVAADSGAGPRGA